LNAICVTTSSSELAIALTSTSQAGEDVVGIPAEGARSVPKIQVSNVSYRFDGGKSRVDVI
jgi:hypothetical protein